MKNLTPVIVEVGKQYLRTWPVRYAGGGRLLGHIFPAAGEMVIVAMFDWGDAHLCRNMGAALRWLAENE